MNYFLQLTLLTTINIILFSGDTAILNESRTQKQNNQLIRIET